MINNVDKQYKELVEKILKHGSSKVDRTGVGTKSIFGHQLVYDMEEGFPLLTLRRIHIKSVIHEMLWFLSSYDLDKYEKFGNTNLRYLLDNGVTFWSEWPYYSYLRSREYRPELPDLSLKEFESKILIDDKFATEFGSIGPGYGKQWLNYGGKVDKKIEDGKQSFIVTKGANQIDYLISELKRNPDSRRLLLTAWKVDELDEMLLPPCHHSFQLYTEKITPENRFKIYSKYIKDNNLPLKPIGDDFPSRKLSMMMIQRSCDLGLGQPFNVAEYALLLHMISQVVNMAPDKLIINLGDVHIYNNHIDQLGELLNRTSYELPTLNLNKNIKNIYDFRFDDIEIDKYKYHPNIKMDVAV